MKLRLPMLGAAVALMFALATGCAGSGQAGGSASSSNRLSAEEISAIGVSTLHGAVQRLRPRWLEVRSQRTMGMDTQILVVVNRTLLGGVDELRSLGVEVALSLEYLDGARAAAEFRLPGDRHVEGVIWVRTHDFR